MVTVATVVMYWLALLNQAFSSYAFILKSEILKSN